MYLSTCLQCNHEYKIKLFSWRQYTSHEYYFKFVIFWQIVTIWYHIILKVLSSGVSLTDAALEIIVFFPFVTLPVLAISTSCYIHTFFLFPVQRRQALCQFLIADCAHSSGYRCFILHIQVGTCWWKTTKGVACCSDIAHASAFDQSLIAVMVASFLFDTGSLIFFLCKGSPSVIRQVPVARLLIPTQIFQQPSAFSS